MISYSIPGFGGKRKNDLVKFDKIENFMVSILYIYFTMS